MKLQIFKNYPRYETLSYFLFVVLAILILVFILQSLGSKQGYVRGVYGKTCYYSYNEWKPASIKHPIYFKSIEDCLESLNLATDGE